LYESRKFFSQSAERIQATVATSAQIMHPTAMTARQGGERDIVKKKETGIIRTFTYISYRLQYIEAVIRYLPRRRDVNAA
jgi:hypothetical protein